ncbi:SEL1-like repeat protein [Methyloligella sp. 2.7D]|uniref:tetratricopeptide repeat protein n=1 Tax=unclassified Methyloligella TaxID=2625955 RepID=UPI00157D69B5|nr:SEL1-like repeat protein [Methyloligella sp. GL2]QKP76931.1 sel1 repeat family protein [Methyloligella sp. GL2]
MDWEREPDLEELREIYLLLERSPDQAEPKLAALAEQQGSIASMWLLAEGYSGTYFPADTSRSKYWYRQAAEAGSEEAAYNLGRLHLEDREDGKAVAAFARGAELGHLPSAYNLALLCREGRGTRKDILRYRKLLECAAADGHLFAKRDLAVDLMTRQSGLKLKFRGFLLLTRLYLIDVPHELLRAWKHGPEIGDHLRG